jgi:hypothetical protein
MINLIKEATNHKRCVSFQYDGLLRIVEPHCYGVSTAGNHVLRGFQVRGGSQTGEIPGWRLYEESKIFHLKLLDEKAQMPRTGYNSNDSAMSRIYCHV